MVLILITIEHAVTTALSDNRRAYDTTNTNYPAVYWNLLLPKKELTLTGSSLSHVNI